MVQDNIPGICGPGVDTPGVCSSEVDTPGARGLGIHPQSVYGLGTNTPATPPYIRSVTGVCPFFSLETLPHGYFCTASNQVSGKLSQKCSLVCPEPLAGSYIAGMRF